MSSLHWRTWQQWSRTDFLPVNAASLITSSVAHLLTVLGVQPALCTSGCVPITKAVSNTFSLFQFFRKLLNWGANPFLRVSQLHYLLSAAHKHTKATLSTEVWCRASLHTNFKDGVLRNRHIHIIIPIGGLKMLGSHCIPGSMPSCSKMGVDLFSRE